MEFKNVGGKNIPKIKILNKEEGINFKEINEQFSTIIDLLQRLTLKLKDFSVKTMFYDIQELTNKLENLNTKTKRLFTGEQRRHVELEETKNKLERLKETMKEMFSVTQRPLKLSFSEKTENDFRQYNNNIDDIYDSLEDFINFIQSTNQTLSSHPQYISQILNEWQGKTNQCNQEIDAIVNQILQFFAPNTGETFSYSIPNDTFSLVISDFNPTVTISVTADYTDTIIDEEAVQEDLNKLETFLDKAREFVNSLSSLFQKISRLLDEGSQNEPQEIIDELDPEVRVIGEELIREIRFLQSDWDDAHIYQAYTE